MNLRRLLLSLLFVYVTAILMKFGNQNYEVLKNDFGILGPLSVLTFGLISGTFGILLFIRSFQRA
ncbi:MAG: hypothetical protein JJ979_10430 [Roseibium sp.]|nr:hypothetical protein [Roseibium sp.]